MAYTTRWIPSDKINEVINLWHTSRVALAGTKYGRYERLQWVTGEFVKKYPEYSRGAAYKDIDGITRP